MTRVVHSATYGFAAPVEGLALDLRLAAAPWEAAGVAAALAAVPPPARILRRGDRWGNRVDRLVFERPVNRLTLSVRLDRGGPPGRLLAARPTAADLAPSAGALPPAEEGPASRGGGDDARVAALVAGLRDGWRFEARERPDAPLGVLERERRGRCLELARLLVWRLRAAGIPARFVLGYALDHGRRGAERERHAWVAHFDGSHWREVDPAEPGRPTAARLATAWGPDLAVIAPVVVRRPADLRTIRAQWSTQIEP